MWRYVFMYNYIHIDIMYIYYVFDVPINFECAPGEYPTHMQEPWIIGWCGLWNDFSEILRNKERILLWIIITKKLPYLHSAYLPRGKYAL